MIIREKQEKKNEKKIEEWAKSKKFAFKGMHTAQFLFLCHNRNEKKNEIKKQTNSGQNIFLGLCTMLICDRKARRRSRKV